MKQDFGSWKNKSFYKTTLICLFVLLFSCNKETPEEVLKKEFLSYITGDWEVDSYSYSNADSPDTTNIDIFNLTSGSITTYGYQYIIPVNPDSSYIDSQEYNITDSNFCKLSKVDKLQYWSIKLESGILMLYASNLCGGYNESFEIVYTNLRYMNNNRQGRAIMADLSIVSLQSEFILSDVIIYNGHEYQGTSFNFAIHGDVDEYFHFRSAN